MSDLPVHYMLCMALCKELCRTMAQQCASWHADLSFGAEAHAEAATALAEMYVTLGQPAAALEILYGLQGVGGALDPQSPAVWPLHWRRASLFLKLGHTVCPLSSNHT